MPYLSPGVYVEEVQSGPRPIEAVGTSTAAFLGVAPDPGAHVQEPVSITNWMQFVREFGKDAQHGTPLAQAVFGFLDNGGSRCYVINVGEGGSIAPKIEGGKRRGIALCEEIDDIALVAAPGYTKHEEHQTVLSHCDKMRDRFCILDAPAEVPSIEKLTIPPGGGDAGAGTGGLRPPFVSYGAFYFPWIVALDPISGKRTEMPPSGHLAGVYARTDATRGVHKAPANEQIRGALDLTYAVTRGDQEILNPAGVNCIRFFPDAGIRIWGARTASNDPQWRYINVRRLFIMVEKSIARGTNALVFEPNDYRTWMNVQRDVGHFLMRVYSSGALFGRTPEEAFFVKCDAETNPAYVVDAGELVTIVGMAPVKPAEFIIFRIGQHEAGTEIE